jgi:phosphoglycerate dehydrogenase-like enzyme
VATQRLLFLTDRGQRHQRAALNAAPPDLDVTIKRRPSPAELDSLLPTADFLITERNQPVTAAMLDRANRLKLIVRLGSLAHDIDLVMAREKGIHVSVQPVLGSIMVAEHMVMMTLAVLKRLKRSLIAASTADHKRPAQRTDENTFSFNWMGYSDLVGLFGKTASILGMGEIGVELARRLRSFGLERLYYYKRKRYPQAVERSLGLRYAEMTECMREADVLMSLLPYSPETDRSIHAGAFALMKPTAVLIHAGSGSVIDEQALVDAIKSGKLAGAALDTYEYEPLQPTHSLVQLARDPASNLLLTPHTAAASLPPDRSEDYAEIVRFLKGKPLKYGVA